MLKSSANAYFLRVILAIIITCIWQQALAQTCGNSVNAPATINGITITGAGTGFTVYGPTFTSCGNVTTPANSLHLGASGSFSYTYTFSQPVNDFVFVINATGHQQNEIFTFTTNGGGTPVITSSNMCFTSIAGNVITSGAGAPSGTGGGGGGVFSITNPSSPFTTLTITGPGGEAGSLVALCDASPAFVCTKPDAGADQTGICNDTTLTLNATSATAGNWFEQAGNPVGATLSSTSGTSASVSFSSASGDYYFVFATGSCSDTVLISVSGNSGCCVPLTFAYTTSVTTADLNTGAAKVIVTSGQPPYSYSLDNSTFQSSNVFTNLPLGTYQLYVTDNTGCTGQGTFTIERAGCCSGQ